MTLPPILRAVVLGLYFLLITVHQGFFFLIIIKEACHGLSVNEMHATGSSVRCLPDSGIAVVGG